MSSDREVERIRRVYSHYDSSPAERRKRDQQNPGNVKRQLEARGLLETMLRQHRGAQLSETRVLDVGCGTGDMLGWIETVGIPPDHLTGVDLLPDRIETARRTHQRMSFQCLNAEQLPFAAGSFDVIVCSTLFSSILDRSMAQRIATSVADVASTSGAVLWYDFRYRSPSNPHTRAMTRSRIAALFPAFELQLRSVSLLPPIARRLGIATQVVYPTLSVLPFLRGHLAGLLVKHAV